MTNEELRKSICDSLKLADRRTLKMIKAMLSEYYAPDDTEAEDADELYAELEKRSKAYKTDRTTLLTVEDVKRNYLKRKKKRGS